jgi:ABC-type transport system involved in cytochrome c biogenesis permease component
MIEKLIFETILGYIDCVGLSIPLFVFVFLGRKVSMPGKEFVIAYFAIFFVGTLLASYLSYNEMYNNWVYDLIPLSLIIPLYFFFRQLPNSKIGKQISVLYLCLFLFYYVITWQTAIDIPLNTEYYLYFAIFILINAAGY